jgi:hypothetical protein
MLRVEWHIFRASGEEDNILLKSMAQTDFTKEIWIMAAQISSKITKDLFSFRILAFNT